MNGSNSIGDPLVEARLRRAILAGVRAVALVTTEDERALVIAEALADRLGWALHTWSVAAGVDRGGRERELGGLLARLSASDEDAIWLLFEAGRELRGSAQHRVLRELAQAKTGPCVVLVEPDQAELPAIPELERERLPVPEFELLRERIQWIADELEPERPTVAPLLREAADSIATAGLGLTLDRFDRVIAEAMLGDGVAPLQLGEALVRRRLTDAWGSQGVALPSASPADLIGFQRYLEWLRERALSATPAAARAGITPTRGVALVGPPGCGQALAARVGAGLLGLPLVDLTAMNPADSMDLTATLASLERAGPVALRIDAADERALPLVRHLARRGPGPRVWVFLELHQPELAPVWEAAKLELFAVDLPDADRRAALVEAWLVRAAAGRAQRRAAEPLEPWLAAARSGSGHSSADLEAALTTARLRALARTRGRRVAELGVTDLELADFEAALGERRPLEAREPELVAALRQFAAAQARPVD